MRLPLAAVSLTLIAALVYVTSSGWLLYPSFDVISRNAFGMGQPLALVFHLFYHVGLKHFVANVAPLFAFAFLLELSITSLEVVLLFLFSGFISAVVFSLLNPTSFLIGASSGLSALMSAAALLRPKLGGLFLIGIPLLTFGVLFPFVDQLASSSFTKMEEEQSALENQALELERQQRFAEAQTLREKAGQVAVELKAQKEGKKREESTQSDFLVHVVGALFGVAFVFWRHPKELEQALEEVWPVFEKIRGLLTRQ